MPLNGFIEIQKPMLPEHLLELKLAKSLLEKPGFAIKASNLIGKPIERGIELLPDSWGQKVVELTKEALRLALNGALLTMKQDGIESYPFWHKVAAVASGAAGGFFGLPAMVIELPVSTTIICRSIADIARANGESVNEVSTKLACMEVFALGGESKADDAGETGYFATRAALAHAVTEASEYLAAHALAEEGAPALVRLIALVASRFQIQVTEKFAAQAIPIIGAAAGATINLLFIDHFQNMSRGHFIVRRLERIYGQSLVKNSYDKI